MNILCLAPFSAAWDLHGYVEMGILQSLKEKGANIINIFCDIKSDYCFLYSNARANCTHCQSLVRAYTADKNLPYIWLSRFSQAQDHEVAVKYVQNISPENYSTAEYGDKKIGKWALSTFISFLRENTFNPNNPLHVEVYRGMLVYALEVSLALERLFKQGRYDRVLMFNGRFLPFSVLLDMAEDRNIPCYLHERGRLPDTYSVVRHIPYTTLHPFLIKPPKEALEIPLSPAQLEKAQALMLQGEKSATSLNWDRFAPMTMHDDLRSQLKIDKDKRIWAFFVSSDDELAAFKGYEYPDFPTQLEGLFRIIQIISEFSDVQLVIRMHPNSGVISRKRVPFADALTLFLNKRKYDNVTVIAADDQINTYQLMQIAEIGLTSSSSCAQEMLHRGKPAMAYNKQISTDEGIFLAETKEDMKNILNRFHNKEISRNELKECFRKGLRYQYFKYFRTGIPFEILKQTSPHTVKPLFKRVEDIKNKNFPALNKLSDQILAGGDIGFDFSDLNQKPGNFEEESAWIDKYMKNWQSEG